MSDSKLDYPAAPAKTGANSPPPLPNSKLDLPGTLAEFQALDGASGAAGTVGLRPFKKKQTAEAIADGAGEARCSFGAPFIGWTWEIERMVVLGAGSVRVYVGGEQNSRVVDLTASGSADVADENSTIYVEEGEIVLVVFSGVTPGVLCTANAQIRYIPGN